jgi:predicted AAA+ superfamily ATPase
MARPDWQYFDLENIIDRTLILSDIALFFREHNSGLILDEVQHEPEVLSYLRGHIDKDRSLCNRLILTGSSSPELLKADTETLAGRTALLEVSPLSMGEQFGKGLSPFFALLEHKLTSDTIHYMLQLNSRLSHEEFKTAWLKGGYPETKTKPEEFLPVWQENYVATYLERDVRHHFPGLNLDNFRRFLMSLHDFHGQQINVAQVARSLIIAESTIRRYLEIAHGMYFWRELQPIERTNLRSITKQPKGFYRDSGLFHFLTRIQDFNDLYRSRYRGASFESFVIEEIMRGISCTSVTNVRYSFVRTRGGLEVDLVIDGSFGRLPIEIKCSSGNALKDVKSLQSFMEREGLPIGIVINQSERTARLSEGIVQLPVTAL